MHMDGTGISKDMAKACELYQRAADDGCLRAPFHLGTCASCTVMMIGDGVAKDCAKACELFQRAVPGGTREAALKLLQLDRQ